MRILVFIGVALYALTGFFNLGFIATDDYWYGISHIIPAQNHSVLEIIQNSAHRSPFANILGFGFTWTALQLGITSPAAQLGFALSILGILNFLILAYAAANHFEDPYKKRISVALLVFYFISPMIFTRFLIEALAAPWLSLCSLFACRYYREGNSKDLGFSMAALVMASTIRYQAGFCAPILFLLPVLRKRLSDWFVLFSVGLVGAGLSGLVDLPKGGWHKSAILYFQYQCEHLASFGSQPVYVFPVLFLLLTFPPLFFYGFHKPSKKDFSGPLFPASALFIWFVVVNSFSPHKEERFMVTVLPLFFVLFTETLAFFRERQRWRLFVFWGLNLLLLALVTFTPPQRNIVNLARYLEAHNEIKAIYGFKNTLLLFPGAFLTRRVEEHRRDQFSEVPCGEHLAVRQDFLPVPEGFQKVEEFSPGILEALVVKFNPKQNLRRGSITLFQRTGCS